MAVGSLALSGSARAAEAPDVTLEIAPYTLEASPKHHIRTVAYNSQIPGLLFRIGFPVPMHPNTVRSCW